MTFFFYFLIYLRFDLHVEFFFFFLLDMKREIATIICHVNMNPGHAAALTVKLWGERGWGCYVI